MSTTKRVFGALFVFWAVLTGCKVEPVPALSAKYITFNVKFQNMPNSLLIDRVYVMNEQNEQVGAGVAYPGNNNMIEVRIPAEFKGNALYACAGVNLVTLYRTGSHISGGETVIVSGGDLHLSLPVNIDDIPLILSSPNITVNNQVSGGTIEAVYVTSLSGVSIADARKENGNWKVSILDMFDGEVLRFWTRFKENTTDYYFYEDLMWNKDHGVALNITYKGKPVITENDLKALSSSTPADHYVLVKDIQLGAAWSPIAFSGNFHGGGNKIKGLRFTGASDKAGLFTTLNGDVDFLRLEVVGGVFSADLISNNGNVSAGVLAAEVPLGSTVKSVSVVRQTASSTLNINSNNSMRVGGICGVLGGSIENSYSNVNVMFNIASSGGSATKNYIGGLVGEIKSTGKIKNSYNMGDVKVQNTNIEGTIAAGGIAGEYVESANGIDSCYSGGTVLCDDNTYAYAAYAGGLVGYAHNGFSLTASAAAITKSAVHSAAVSALRTGLAGPLIGNDNYTGNSCVLSASGRTLTAETLYTSGASTAALTTSSNWPFGANTLPWYWDSALVPPRPGLAWERELDIDALVSDFSSIDFNEISKHVKF